MCVCVPCACRALVSQKRESDPLGLELLMVVSYHIDAGNLPQSSGRAATALNH